MRFFVAAILTLLVAVQLLGWASAQTPVTIDLNGASFYSSSGATMTKVSLGTGQPSTVALRINVPVTTGNVWDNGVNIQTTLPNNVAQNDWFLMKFSVRQVAGQTNFPVGKGIQAVINIRPFSGGYVNSLDATFPCDSTSWCNYAIAFRANEAQTNANPPYIMFQMSEGPQTFDIAVTSLTWYGTTKPPVSQYAFYYSQGSITGVTLTVRNPAASARVGFSIVPSASSNNSPVIATGTNNNVNVAAGATGSYSFVATIPSGTATGQYRVTLGLWDVNWNSLDWVNNGFYLTIN